MSRDSDEVYEEKYWSAASGCYVKTGRLVKKVWDAVSGGYNEAPAGYGTVEKRWDAGSGGYYTVVKKKKNRT